MFSFLSVGVWSCWISCLNIRTMDLDLQSFCPFRCCSSHTCVKCHVFWMDSDPFRSEWSRADSVFMRLFCGGWTEDGSAAVMTQLWSFRRVFVCSSSFNVQFVVKPYRPDDIYCSSTAFLMPSTAQFCVFYSLYCFYCSSAVRWTCILPGRTWTRPSFKNKNRTHSQSEEIWCINI